MKYIISSLFILIQYSYIQLLSISRYDKLSNTINCNSFVFALTKISNNKIPISSSCINDQIISVYNSTITYTNSHQIFYILPLH